MPVELTDEEFLGAPAAPAVKELSDEEFLGPSTIKPRDYLTAPAIRKPLTAPVAGISTGTPPPTPALTPRDLKAQLEQRAAGPELVSNVLVPFSEGGMKALTLSPSAALETMEQGTEAAASSLLGRPVQWLWHPSETMRRQIIGKIPEVPTKPSMSTPAALGVGTVNAVVEFANFLQTPEFIAYLGIGKLPKPAQQAALADISGQVAAQAPEQFNDALEKFRKGDVAGGMKSAVSGTISVGVAAGAGKGAVRVGETPMLKVPAEKPISPAGPVPPLPEAAPEAAITPSKTVAPAGEITAKVGTVAEPPIPEAPATLQEQVRLAADPASTRAAALITPGAEFAGQVPEGMKSTLTKHGTVIWNPAKVTEAQVTAAAKGDVFDNRILGGASGTKPVQGDTVVTTKTPAADDVQTELVPTGDAAAVEAAKKAQQAAVPGGTTEVKPAVEVLEKREAKNAIEKGQVQGGVPVERPRTNAQRATPEAGVSDSLRAAEEAKNLPPQEPVKGAEKSGGAEPRGTEPLSREAKDLLKSQGKGWIPATGVGAKKTAVDFVDYASGKAKPFADAENENYRAFVTPSRQIFIESKGAEGHPLLFGLWMDEWEPWMKKEHGLSKADYLKMSEKQRAEIELGKQVDKYAKDEYADAFARTYFPKEWEAWWKSEWDKNRGKPGYDGPKWKDQRKHWEDFLAERGYSKQGDRFVLEKQPTPPPPSPTGGEMRLGPGEGPGARTAGTPATGGSQIEQLASAFANKAPAAERAKQLARESFAYGERAGQAKDALSRALSGLKNSGQALWTALTKFEKPDELLKAKGVLSAELETRGWRVREFAKNVQRAIPDKRRRAAIAKWIDSGGDDARLTLGEAATKPQFKQAYRDARNLTPEEKVHAQNIQNYFEARLDEAIDAGVLEQGLEDYLHRIYPKDSATRQKAIAYVQSGILSKNPSLARKRFYEWDYEAEAAGLRPVQDFLPRLTDYETSLSKAIAARAFVGKATQMVAADGRPLIGIKGLGIPVEDQNGVRTGTVIKPLGDFRKAATPGTPDYRGDYKVKEYPALSRWKWVATDTDGKPIFVQGDVAIHPDFVSRFESLLEPSHVRYGSNEKLAKLGRGALGASTTVKQTMLDLSGFHQVQIGLHAMEHRVFPWQVVKTIDFADPKVEGLLKGGVTLGGEFHDANFGEGLFGKSLSQHVPILGPVAETYHNWLFQSFIPRVKMTMALHALERNRTRYAKDLASGRMTEDDLNLLTAKQANAAFGELNYIMLERNKTIQDMARLTLLAPDFLEARGRFVAQALTKYGTEQRVALLLGAATLFTLARVANKIADDQYHWEPENLFSLVYKNRAYSLRTVQGDVLHLLDDPITFWMNRLNPTFSRFALEAVSHRDQFGRKRSVPEAMLDTIKNIQPIATRFGRERKLWESIMSAFGGTVRRWNDVDKAFKMAQEWKSANNIQQRGEFIYDPEKDPLRPLKIALSYGEPDAVQELVKMTPAEVQKARDYFQRYINLPFTGSRDNDVKWMKTLSTDQRQTVEAARLHRQDMGRRFMSALAQYRSLRANPPTAP